MLTPAEEQIVELVALGWSNQEIANHRKVSVDTVKHQLSGIFDKLGFWNRVEVAAWEVKRRLDALHQ